MSTSYRRIFRDDRGRQHSVVADSSGTVYLYFHIAPFRPEDAMKVAESIVEAVFVAEGKSGPDTIKNLVELPLPD